MADPGEGRGPVTDLLLRASSGDRDAFDQAFSLVYDELKRLAHGALRLEDPGHILDTTALVHEAYLKLVDQDRAEWRSRTHFHAIASKAMRRILIDHARKRVAVKRGGDRQGVPLETVAHELAEYDRAASLVALGEALRQLHQVNPRGADVVQYRYFGGMTYCEIAEVLGVAEITVRRSWTMAKTWLRRALADERGQAGAASGP